MDQQQFRVSFPLATKLILSVVLLLLGVVIFLNVSAILLLKEDKRAYTYQSQQTGAVLSGREFVGAIQRMTTMLRLSLTNFDPTQPMTEAQKNSFQSLIENQTDLIAASVYLVDINSMQGSLQGNAMRTKEVKDLNFDQQSYPPMTEEIVKQIVPELKNKSYAFYNPSKDGGFPLLLIFFADVNAQNNPKGMPVSVGYFPLDRFVRSELGGLNLTIATKSGQVLFDTDPSIFYTKKSITDDPLFVTASSSKLSGGATEYDFEGKRYVGSYIHPGWDLVVLNKIEWKKAIKATYELTIKFVLLGIAAIGLAIIYTIFSSKKLVAPLNILYRATKEVAQGNFNVKMAVESKDEIGALTGSFNVMSEKIEELIQESMIKVKMENELAIASTVQERLIPNSSVHEGRVFIKSFYMSASQCGGDWWGYFIERNKLCIAIADATGHGFPSALITASARSCFSMIRKMVQENAHIEIRPNRLLDYANRVIYESALGRIMMTFFVAVIDLDTLSMSYASAGHNPPWVFKKSDQGYTLVSLIGAGMRLGEAAEMDLSEERQVQLSADDIFVLYTDGFTEGKSPEGVMYGKKRLRKIIEASLAGGPESVVNNLVGDFFKHNDEKPLDDDLTFAAVTFNNQPT
jgi:sigma-B regulation protein RsbU (phosphoserine phosphatase)